MDFEAIMKIVGYMLEASKTTLAIFFLTLLFGLPLGLLISLGRMSKYKILNVPIRIYLLVMRGTPLILQLYFFYFGVFYISNRMLNIPRFWAAIIGFTLNYAAYFAEIYRGGIQSVPKGQYEAAQVLGFSKGQTFMKIILPQVIKRILPPMSNEFMTLVKDTSLAYAIGVAEMYMFATDKMATTGSIAPLLVAGVFYLIMNMIVSKGFSVAEKKLSYYS